LAKKKIMFAKSHKLLLLSASQVAILMPVAVALQPVSVQ
jgi:hypothetical protein